MKEEFEKLAAAGKIEGRHVAPLTHLAEAGCCIHRSWGFGRIKTVDTVFARFTIDFQGKPGHPMDLAFAAESLKPVAKDHILARKATDLDAVRHLAAHHLDLIKMVLEQLWRQGDDGPDSAGPGARCDHVTTGKNGGKPPGAK